MNITKQKIIIVGGGAGGLELATMLGNKLGRSGKAEVTLVDSNPSHLWKPLLHEIATGVFDYNEQALSYLSHAKAHGFTFKLGRMVDLDRENKTINLAAVCNAEGEELIAASTLSYDVLVMAVGSVANDFNTPGVKEHCILLDTANAAKAFNSAMLDKFTAFASGTNKQEHLRVAIVGAGATGVELSAELHHAVESFNYYGLNRLNSSSLKITLIEAGDRILPVLPEDVAAETDKVLTQLGVNILTKTMITGADATSFSTKSGEKIEADLLVWAAGVKAPDFIKELAGLETNRINQLVVKPTLQTTQDDAIFAIGDCAACPLDKGTGFVPPKAQSAHQMAIRCSKNILAYLAGQPLQPFVYFDKGTIVSLSSFTAIASVFGAQLKKPLMLKGWLVKCMYRMLYRMHQQVLHGSLRLIGVMIGSRLMRSVKSKVKLFK